MSEFEANRMTAKEIAKEVLTGEWNHYAIDTFTEAAELLLSKGMTAEETAELLSDLRSAVADSYGD